MVSRRNSSGTFRRNQVEETEQDLTWCDHYLSAGGYYAKQERVDDARQTAT
jgi:hypothetical protein